MTSSGAPIRIASRDDLDAVRDLVERAYSPWVERVGRRPAPMDADYAALIAAGSVWVTPDAGPLRGIVVLVAAEDHLLLENVAIAPDAQATGLGSALLSFVDEEARALGLPEIRLYTNERMSENLAYYARRGFHETHRTGTSPTRRVWFSKRLARGS